MSEDKAKAPDLCVICATTELTIDNIVNPTCGHAQCKNCFWRWSKTSNQCPFCRQDIIARDRQSELEIKKLIENRRDLITHINDLNTQYLGVKRELDTVRREYQLETINLHHRRGEIARKNQDSFLYHEILNLYWRDPAAAKNRLLNLTKETYNIYRIDWLKKISQCFDEYGIRIRRERVFERYPLNSFWRKTYIKIGGKVIRAERVRRRQQINNSNIRHNARLSPATAISPETSQSRLSMSPPARPIGPPQIRRIPFPGFTSATFPLRSGRSPVPLSQSMSRLRTHDTSEIDFIRYPNTATVRSTGTDLFYNYRTSLFYENTARSPRTATMRRE